MREIAEQEAQEMEEAARPKPPKTYKVTGKTSGAMAVSKPKANKPRCDPSSTRKKKRLSNGASAYLQDCGVWRQIQKAFPTSCVSELSAKLMTQWTALSASEKSGWENLNSPLSQDEAVILSECATRRRQVLVQPAGKGPKHRWRGWIHSLVISDLLQQRSAIVYRDLLGADGKVTSTPRSVDIKSSKVFVCEELLWAKVRGFPWWPAVRYTLLHSPMSESITQFLHTWSVYSCLL